MLTKDAISPSMMHWTLFCVILCIWHEVKAGDGGWTAWSQWSPCSVTCGLGVRRRYRACENPPPTHGGKWCTGTMRESEECEASFACPVDGGWTMWSAWTPCSTTCGQGTRRRTRTCNEPEPIFGGKDCEGATENIEMCKNLETCPRDGGWSAWSNWSPCSVTCGIGVSVKYRVCNNPPPAADGKPCLGATSINKDCNKTIHCPVNGQWSAWSDWSPCSVTCGTGQTQRVRSCDNPPARFGGAPCNSTEKGHIDLDTCSGSTPHCPVDGVWSEWSEYGPCETLNCQDPGAVANAFRHRSCNNPLPEHGGAMCEGTFLDSGICMHPENCKRDGEWSEWTDWRCTASLAQRVRVCDNPPPSNGGTPCPEEQATEVYNREDNEDVYSNVCEGGEGDENDEELPLYEDKDHDPPVTEPDYDFD